MVDLSPFMPWLNESAMGDVEPDLPIQPPPPPAPSGYRWIVSAESGSSNRRRLQLFNGETPLTIYERFDPHSGDDREKQLARLATRQVFPLDDKTLVEAALIAALREVDYYEQPYDDGELNIMTGSQLHAKKLTREWLAKDLFVVGELGVWGGPKKTLKTGTLMDFGVSVSTGKKFLNQFVVPKPRPVLLMSGESGEITLQDTQDRVCRSKGLDPNKLDSFFITDRLTNFDDMKKLRKLQQFIKHHKIEVVIDDPLYLSLGEKASQNAGNVYIVGPTLRRVAKMMQEVGATLIVAHHTKKNRTIQGDIDQYSHMDLEDLTFAGVQEVARQWVILSRRARFRPGTGFHQLWCTVGGSAGQNSLWSLDVSEGAGGKITERIWQPVIREVGEDEPVDAAATNQQKQEQKKKERDEQRLKDEADRAAARQKQRESFAAEKAAKKAKERADRAVESKAKIVAFLKLKGVEQPWKPIRVGAGLAVNDFEWLTELIRDHVVAQSFTTIRGKATEVYSIKGAKSARDDHAEV